MGANGPPGSVDQIPLLTIVILAQETLFHHGSSEHEVAVEDIVEGTEGGATGKGR